MPLAADAQQRLDALRRFLVVDAPEEDELARLVRVAATVYGVAYAVLTIREPDAEEQGAEASEGVFRVAAVFGTEADEFGADDSLIDGLEEPILPMTVNDAAEDKRFSRNPLVRSGKARFYAGVPLKSGHGFTIGTLALLDPEPQEMNGDGLSLLVDLGALVEPVLNQREFQRERNAAVAVREAASFEAATMATERDAARDERDSAIEERKAALVELEAAKAERDAAVADMEAALASRGDLEAGGESLAAERDAALAQRDTLAAERDTLAAELESLRADRDAATTAIESVKSDLESARSELEATRIDRDTAIGDKDALAMSVRTVTAERDEARAELEAALRAREATIQERDAARVERDAALAQRGSDADEQRTSIAERDTALTERDAAVADREASQREMVGLRAALDAARAEAAEAARQTQASRDEAGATAQQLEAVRDEAARHAVEMQAAREEHAAALRALETARREHAAAMQELEAAAKTSSDGGPGAADGRLSELIEVAPVPLLAVARDGSLTLANGRARMLLGLGEDLAGTSLEAIVAEGDIGRLQPLLRQPGTRPVEIGVTDATGALRPVRVSVASTPGTGDGAVMLAIRTLETERRLAETLREREAALAEAKAPAPATVDGLMVTVHNEVINALRALSEYAALQAARDADGELREMAGAVNGVSGRLLRILEGTFDVVGVGAPAPGLMPVELGPATETVATKYRESAEARDLAFVVDAPDDGTTAWADPESLTHVLDALLSNAVAHTVRGGIRIRVALEEDRASVEVQDTGVGVDSQTLADALSGSTSGVTRPGGGVGLGLALARRMADRMGAELTGRSVPGQGSVFRLQLRAAPPANVAPGGDGVAAEAAVTG
jgi:signal transduction histidine kinase